MSAVEVLTVVVVRKAVAVAVVHAHSSPAYVRSLSETQLLVTPWAAATAVGGPN